MSVQRGFAMIAILALIALIAAFLISSALNRTAADVFNEREDRSMSALRKAKAALIAYAANEQWQAGGATPFQPGALPCPDRDNDGKADDHQFPQKPCNTAPKRIGRFPWKTIGADDLRDASGEALWYVVSATFLQNTPLYTNVINSDTAGQLTVTGSIPASNVVAIVFAPGEAIQGQMRSPASVNDPASYLEQFDGVSYATFTSTSLPTTINNDRLLVITQADLMNTVEPVVAANIERDVKPRIQTYASDWGVYPFAAPFSPAGPGRTMAQYHGAGVQKGLLPLTTETTFAGWQPSSISVTQLPQPPNGTGTSTVTSVDCSGSTDVTVVCRIDYSGGTNDRPDIKLQATLSNVANSFIRPVVQSDKSITDYFGNTIDWSTVGSPPLTPTVSNTLQPSGNATVIFTGRLRSAGSTNNRVWFSVSVSFNPITDINDVTSGWFIANEWYRQTYYAVSSGFVLGGGGTCNPFPGTPPCLTVNMLPPSYAIPNDKGAILVLAGRALNGTLRPSTNIADYLENANLSAALGTTLVYEHRAGGPTSINDRVVVVAP
jgi:type II secretory pathway pseudopilin PulG